VCIVWPVLVLPGHALWVATRSVLGSGWLGAKLIELKFSQFLILGFNQYQLIPKCGRVHSTHIMLVSFCVGSIQQTEQTRGGKLKTKRKREGRYQVPGWGKRKRQERRQCKDDSERGTLCLSNTNSVNIYRRVIL